MTSRFKPAPSAATGFTLIELVVVLAILGLMSSLALLRGPALSPATSAHGLAREVAGALRAARGEAIMTDRSVAFSLDLAAASYRWGSEPPRALPRDVQVGLLIGTEQAESATSGRIRFDPDGGSSGGRVSIAGGGRLWWVGADWLSGRVTVAEKTP